jgi:hypothetical protein
LGKGNPQHPSRKRPRKERPREHTALTWATLAGVFMHDNEQKKGEAQRIAETPRAQAAKLEISRGVRRVGLWAGC